MWGAYAVVFTICFVKDSREWDWCSDDASCLINGVKIKNTMCTMKAASENSAYTQIKDATDKDVRRSMLTWHNTYRDKIANGEIPGWPKAADMRQLTYDQELETVSLRWSFQTMRGHDKCRRTQKFKDVGQNCGMLWNTPGQPYRNISETFTGWVDEILLTDASIVDKLKFEVTYGHFTAIVWADTYKIGCSTTTFQPKKGGSNKFSHLQGRHTGCNLAPAGNIRTLKMYTRGEPCTACPAGTACNSNSTHPHLCAKPGDPADEVPDFIGKLPSGGVINVMAYYWASVMLMVTFTL